MSKYVCRRKMMVVLYEKRTIENREKIAGIRQIFLQKKKKQ